jgi:hypothetical protein
MERGGKISGEERDRFRRFVRTASDEDWSVLAEVLADEGVRLGLVSESDVPKAGASDRDWAGFLEKLIAAFEKIMPLILAFIEMFSKFA